MTWADLWAFYKVQPSTIQYDIEKQINIRDFVSSLSEKHQIEVLGEAPLEIIRQVVDLLPSNLLKKLNIKREKAQKPVYAFRGARPANLQERLKRK